MKFMKRAVAFVMAAMLVLPSVTIMATEGEPSEESSNMVEYEIDGEAYTVVTADVEQSEERMYDKFSEDGSYTIVLSGENLEFPYNVNFTFNGEKMTRTFGSEEEEVEVGGHIFRMEIFDIAPQTLIPLHEKTLTMNLTGLTPVELTKVPIKEKLEASGENLSGATKIAWRPQYSDDDYMVSVIDDFIDLSGSISQNWEMIVGDGDQLNEDNTRYFITIQTTNSAQWLVPQVYVQEKDGSRSSVAIGEYSYYPRSLRTMIPGRIIEGKDSYLSLKVNGDLFQKSKINHLKYVEGAFTAKEVIAALSAHDVTDQVISTGYKVDGISDTELTMIAYDAAGNVIGCLPFTYYAYDSQYIIASLYDGTTKLGEEINFYQNEELSFGLDEPRKLDGNYKLTLNYNKGQSSGYPDITSVYIGQYESIAQAKAAGATDIKNTVYGSVNDGKGYGADFSKGIYFTVFAGEDSDPSQAVYSFNVKTVRSGASGTSKDNRTDLAFDPYLIDESGNHIDVYIIHNQDDSYAEENYITMLVPSDLDMSKKYAPVFSTSDKATVYTSGASQPEKSGESFHFLNDSIQYTVNAENGVAVKNYWLQVKQAVSNTNGQLYINSLIDENANTRIENGIIYSTREMMLDSYHENRHDICFVNVGSNELANLSADLVSDVVELDPYWTLTGDQPLAGMSTIETPSYDSGLSGELPNLAKVRLRKKAGVKDGTEISGTLTIKSGGTALMVLTLTGVVGDPCITTEDIPDAVKYVPYGTVIQNSNKYSWIQPHYELAGNLPEGMELRPNGEVYGVPQETGNFEFQVEVSFESMRSDVRFSPQHATFTLSVNENIDEDVYYASDENGYMLITPIGVETSRGNCHFYLEHVEDSLFVSEGSFDEFIDLWLNGKKLVKGEDYRVESGSTRITVIAQTMRNKANQSGRNTIAAEFRVNGDINDNLKRTAQNFYLDNTEERPGSSGGSGGSGGPGSFGDSGGNSTPGSSVDSGENSSGSGAGGASVSTGDNLNLGVGIALALLFIAVLAGTVFFYKKKHGFSIR